MTRAEEQALKAYPIKIAVREGYDENLRERKGFVKGYKQAEKDLTDKAKFSSGWDGFYYGQGYKQAEKDTREEIAKQLAKQWSDGYSEGYTKAEQDLMEKFKMWVVHNGYTAQESELVYNNFKRFITES